jgi:hypothetical protein
MKAISSLLSSNRKRKSMAATKERSKIQLDITPISSAPPSPPQSPLPRNRKYPVSTSASASTITTTASLDYDSEHIYDYNDRPQVPGFFESPRAVPPIPSTNSTSSSASSITSPRSLSPPRSPSRLSVKNASIPWISKPKPAGHPEVLIGPKNERLVLLPNTAAGDRRTVSYSTPLVNASRRSFNEFSIDLLTPEMYPS